MSSQQLKWAAMWCKLIGKLRDMADHIKSHMLAERARTGTLLKRFPTLAEVADFVAFVASDRAGAMTGAIVNLTCGSLVD
jgi:NAD(P)-dependent dehydrogenase (short-subunit alcohol dehydrogenase family)